MTLLSMAVHGKVEKTTHGIVPAMIVSLLCPGDLSSHDLSVQGPCSLHLHMCDAESQQLFPRSSEDGVQALSFKVSHHGVTFGLADK